jgi:hypothetical protein
MKSTVTIQFDNSATKKRKISGHWCLNEEGELFLENRLQELRDKYQTGPRGGWSCRYKRAEYDYLSPRNGFRTPQRLLVVNIVRHRYWKTRRRINKFLTDLEKFYTEYEIIIESRASEFTNHGEWMGDYFNNLICEKYGGILSGGWRTNQGVQTFYFKNGERGRVCHEYLKEHFAQRPYMPTGDYKLITFTDRFNERAR